MSVWDIRQIIESHIPWWASLLPIVGVVALALYVRLSGNWNKKWP